MPRSCSLLFISLLAVSYLVGYSSAHPTEDWLKINVKKAEKILKDDWVSRSVISQIDDVELHRLYGESFENFIEQHGKQYASDEKKMERFKIFCENMLKVKSLEKFDKGTAVYGVTKFSDLTREEFRKKYTGLLPRSQRSNNDFNMNMKEAEIPDVQLPPIVDWREEEAVTPVKDQGDCGSCYAFAISGNIEGQHAIKNKKLIELSEQEIVDCDTYDFGCDGGLLQLTYLAVQEMGGLETEKDYPYESYKQFNCYIKEDASKVKITGSVNISSNEHDIAKWLTANGPVAVSLNAEYLQHYVSGVTYLPQFICDPERLNHAVLIVGYGVQATEISFIHVPYWIVKNSWAENWGEEGYFRIFRGAGTCGINTEANSAIVQEE